MDFSQSDALRVGANQHVQQCRPTMPIAGDINQIPGSHFLLFAIAFTNHSTAIMGQKTLPSAAHFALKARGLHQGTAWRQRSLLSK